MNDNFNDHFTEHDDEKVEKKHVETAQEREDREIEESTISRRHNTMRTAIITACSVLLAALVGWMWFHYYHPTAQRYEKGWIMDVANEGTIFKTLECKVITQDLILDTVKVKWNRDTVMLDGCNLTVSLGADSLTEEAVKWKGTGKRVIITYDEYSGSLPWRGSTPRIVRSITPDTVN